MRIKLSQKSCLPVGREKVKSLKNKNLRLEQVLRQNSGQAMLILVMVIGSTMLGVSTIAGYISLQKIRTATDIVDSAKSIYAADAGVEWCFYQRKDNPETPCNNEGNQPVMGNDSSVSVNQLGNIVKSIGHSNRSYRAFGIFLDQFN